MSPRIFDTWAVVAAVTAYLAGVYLVSYQAASLCPDTSFKWWLGFLPGKGYVSLYIAAWWWSVGRFVFDPASTIKDLLTFKHIVLLWFTSLGATAVGIFFFPSDEGVRALAGCADNGDDYFIFATAPFAIGMFASWIALIAVATWVAQLAKAKR